MKEDSLTIPYGKAVRVGSFKLWRGKYNIASGKEKAFIDCLHVSSLDGAWMVRIPATSQMFATIMQGYATVDETLRENFIGMIVTNIYNLSTIPSVALHDAFHFLMEMMAFPYLLLPEKEMEKRMKEGMKADGMEKARIKEHVAKMMEYRRDLYALIERKKNDFLSEYERQQQQQRAAEPEELDRMEQDAIAEQALEILNEEEDEQKEE